MRGLQLAKRTPCKGWWQQQKRDNPLLHLPFLDTLHRRKRDGSLDVTVYRKPTHTDHYLNFQSHHSNYVKRGLVRCLHNRAGTSLAHRTISHRRSTTSPRSWGRTAIPMPSSAPLPGHNPPKTLMTRKWNSRVMACRDPHWWCSLCRGNQRGRQTCLQEVWPEGDLQPGRTLWSVLTKVKVTSSREAIQGRVPDSLWLWNDLHWRDNQEAWDKNEEAPGCLLQGNGGEVGRGRTRQGAPPPHQVGRHQSDRPNRKVQRVPADWSPPHPDGN